MSLFACPPELLHHIFALACADGGHTGRALAAVSRGVAAASAPHRLRALQAAGAPQLRALLRILEYAHAPDVRHLLICDRRACEADDQPQPVHVPRYRSGTGWESGSESEMDADDAWTCAIKMETVAGAEAEAEERAAQAASDALNALVRALLAMCARTLRTLTVLVFDPHERDLFVSVVARTPLPRLAALTLRFSASPAYVPASLLRARLSPPSPPSESENHCQSQPPQLETQTQTPATTAAPKIHLPELRELRATAPQLVVLRGLFAAPALLAAACPALAHVALLEVPTRPRHFIDALGCLLLRPHSGDGGLWPLLRGGVGAAREGGAEEGSGGGAWLASPSVCATLPRFGGRGAVKRVSVEPLDAEGSVVQAGGSGERGGSEGVEKEGEEALELRVLDPVAKARSFEDWRSEWLEKIAVRWDAF
jgi:hypothetical protein